MKSCSTCHKSKPYTDFYKNARSTDGLGNRCKRCMQAYGKLWYKRNAAAHKAATHKGKQIQREVVRMWLLWYLLEHPCVDCSEADPVVLDFDHVRGRKTYNIAALAQQGASLSRVVAEIMKCDVRCANCHRRATASRRGTDRKL
jgi:bacterioferritin-associated ferredoxin